MIRFFGQKKFSNTDPTRLIGYEFLLRERVDGRWCLPDDFKKFSPEEIGQLLADTLAVLPADLELLSFNLDQSQFVCPDFRANILRVLRERQVNLYVELTERDDQESISELVEAAKEYEEAGVRVVLDDVGTGANRQGMAAALDQYTSEYKFALQNVRDLPDHELHAQLRFWRDFAEKQHKLFAIEGFETEQDVHMAQAYRPDVMQGYYFGHPELIALAE